MKTAPRLVAALLAVLAVTACKTTDVGEDGPQLAAEAEMASLSPGARPALDSDEGGLWMVMDRMEESLRTSGKLIHDAALNAYVRDVACRLAGPHCKDIRVYLVRVPHFNASMAPNGTMQVWSGLLLRVRNEAQLAAVLGHEIGHFVRRHTLQRFRSARAASDFLVFFQIAMGGAGIPAVGDVASLVLLASQMSFGRDQEREADRIGLTLMAKAGYDPREAAAIWRQLIAEEEADKENEKPRSVFFATHPSPEERVETLAKLAEEAAAQRAGGERNEQRYRKAIGRLRRDFLRDEMHLRQFPRSHKLLDMLLEDGWRPGEIHFYRGELHRIRGEKEDLEKAIEAYEKAIGTGDCPPETYRSLGLVQRTRGEAAKAKAAFAEYLRRVPNAEDRLMVQSMIEAMS